MLKCAINIFKMHRIMVDRQIEINSKIRNGPKKICSSKNHTLLIWLSKAAKTSAGIDVEDLEIPPRRMRQNSNISIGN